MRTKIEVRDLKKSFASDKGTLPVVAAISLIFEVPFAHPRRLAGREVQELRIAILSELGVDRGELGS
jgi:hypothetical protein